MSDLVTADDVTGAAGSARAEGSPPAEDTHPPRLEEGLVDQVRRQLEELGFQVLQAGPGSVTIAADPEVFERVFSARLLPGEP